MSEITTVGLDLAKNVFQLHGADASGRAVLRRRLRQGQVLEVLAGPCCAKLLKDRLPLSPPDVSRRAA